MGELGITFAGDHISSAVFSFSAGVAAKSLDTVLAIGELSILKFVAQHTELSLDTLATLQFFFLALFFDGGYEKTARTMNLLSNRACAVVGALWECGARAQVLGVSRVRGASGAGLGGEVGTGECSSVQEVVRVDTLV